MKRWIWLVLAAVLLGCCESPGTDVGKLRPVEVLIVSCQGNLVVLQTDTADLGQGATLEEAVENLQATAPAQVFLDTAEYLLISREALHLLPKLRGYLRPSCGVCLLEGEPVGDFASYLKIHQPTQTLANHNPGELETLKVTEGRMELVS